MSLERNNFFGKRFDSLGQNFFEKVVDDLISSKNDLLDGIYELNCSLSFIAEATNNMMDKENSNIMEDVSYGFYKKLMGLKENLNNIMNKFESKIS